MPLLFLTFSRRDWKYEIVAYRCTKMQNWSFHRSAPTFLLTADRRSNPLPIPAFRERLVRENHLNTKKSLGLVSIPCYTKPPHYSNNQKIPRKKSTRRELRWVCSTRYTEIKSAIRCGFEITPPFQAAPSRDAWSPDLPQKNNVSQLR